MAYALFYLVILIALLVSALFVWGVWQALNHRSIQKKQYDSSRQRFGFQRNEHNPIMQPGMYDFEREAVMNPTAVHDGERTHIFYRAIGNDGVSRLGYATSNDGKTIDGRLPYPVYAHRNLPPRTDLLRKYSIAHYGSGGSWSGCEDARATFIEDRLYLIYNAFNGWDSQRVAVTSLSREDLAARRWNFSKPNFLSPTGQRHKNWMLFPEKIGGKFALFHNLHTADPDRVCIEYIDDIESYNPETHPIESADPNALGDRPLSWHRRMRSLSAPPIKTAKGWLTFYHAMDWFHPNQYKMGAMLLDSTDPTKIIARSPVPVLMPEAHYETNGAKPGVVYSCGATAQNDNLTVYYGASDNFVCSASTSLSSFLESLRKNKPPMLTIMPA